MNVLRFKRNRVLKLIATPVITFYTLSILISHGSKSERDIVDKLSGKNIDIKMKQLEDRMLQQKQNGNIFQDNGQNFDNRLGISQDTYLYRKGRYEKYQSTMFQVKIIFIFT